MCERIEEGEADMATIGDGFKDIFLAGVGAMAITGEKATDLVSTLIAKGELTVEQGKQINTELAHKAANVAQSARFDALEARMSVMTPEEREAFAAKAAEIAARPAAQPVQEQPQAEGSQKPSDQAEASAEQ
ncbi:MAG: hypothetical protein V8T19_01965 [Senegalimassilia anaerobia]